MEPKWLKWGKSLQTIAQSGLTYSENDFDLQRYRLILQIASEMMAENSGTDLQKVTDLFNSEIGYSTPKVDVRGAAFKDGKILLVKEKIDGKWTLPGGWADPNETPSESVVRELFEESGYKAKAIKLAGIFDRTKRNHLPYYPFHVYKLFFICELIGGSSADSIETEGAEFFEMNNLPELSASRVNTEQIRIMFKHYKNINLPTEYD